MGANEDRIKNLRKKELFENNTKKPKNNSRSIANRRKWDLSDLKPQNDLAHNSRSKSRHNPTIENNTKRFDYKAVSKLILNHNNTNINFNNSTSKNIVSKESMSNIEDLLNDINTVNINVNSLNKFNINSEYPISKRRKNWNEPKYGIVFPDLSTSTEQGVGISGKNTKKRNMTNYSNCNLASINNLNSSFNKITENEIDCYNSVIADNLNNINSSISGLSKEKDFYLTNKNSNEKINLQFKNSGSSLILSNLNQSLSNNNLNLNKNNLNSSKINLQSNKNIYSNPDLVYNKLNSDNSPNIFESNINTNRFWEGGASAPAQPCDLNNSQENMLVLENFNNSDVLNLSNCASGNFNLNLFNNSKLNSGKFISLNSKDKINEKKNKFLINNSSNERPFSSILNLSKIKADKLKITDLGGSTYGQSPKNSIPNIEFIYKSPQNINNKSSQRPLSHIQKSKSNLNSKGGQPNPFESSYNAFQLKNSNTYATIERFSSREKKNFFVNNNQNLFEENNFKEISNSNFNFNRKKNQYPTISKIQKINQNGISNIFYKRKFFL